MVAIVVRFGVGVTLSRSAHVQGVSRPPHTASRDCRTAHPLPVRTRVRLHRNTGSGHTRKGTKRANDATRCEIAPAFVVCAPTRSAPSRAGMAGWVGEGGGRFGERREYEAPTLPSTPRQHGMARHQTCQARNATTARCGSPLQEPGMKQHATAALCGTLTHKPARQKHHDNTPHASQPRNTPTRPHTTQPNGPDTRTQTSPATPAHIPITTP